MPRLTRRFVVLASGFATMALQMCAVRLLAPWVGSSSLVWATTIGLSLLAMSLGYLLGGRLADRTPDGRVLARTLLAAAVLTALIPAIAEVLLPHATLGIDDAAWASVAGTGLGFLVMFFAPALLLGITPPFVIRHTVDAVESGGRTVGHLYALSTVGSILGTVLTALVLVQWVGTRATLFALAGLLLLAALAASRLGIARRPAARGEAALHGEVALPTRAPGAIPLGLAGVIVVVEGTAMMATEMSVARLVAPFFGASHAVWAVIIAVVMGSIALGSVLGGRLADRFPRLPALVVLLATAGAAVALLPFAAAPIMRLSTGGIDDVAVGTVVGAFLGTMAVLVVPVTLLGMVPPWTLRLALPGVEAAGRTSGRLYALSTAGALIGTFASVLWLIPALGTRRTMLLFAGALALLALYLLLSNVTDTPGRVAVAVPVAGVLLVAALAFAPTGLVKPLDDAKVVSEAESRYQFIQVVEGASGRRVLQLNEGWAVHSVYSPDTVLTGGIWDHFLVLPSLADDPERMLIIGNAAGTAPRAFREYWPDIHIDGVELDAEVTAQGRRWFDMTGDNLTVTTADGRPFLDRADGRTWDVIHIDAYRQPYIPFYLTTREFFGLAKSRLAPGGVLSINVGSTPDDPRINEAVAATMRDVFGHVARYRAETYNEVIIAKVDGDEPRVGQAPSPDLDELFANFDTGMRPVEPDADRVLTDDRAAVEWMTDRMIFGEAG
ncbi:MAG: Spermine synthase [Thermoleophilia bacterium]|nr:Spermine synthase [Thermoleophilia bacterium]